APVAVVAGLVFHPVAAARESERLAPAMRRLATAAIAGCAALAACALHRMPGTAEPLPDARRGLRGLLQAGAARADVTPPPGPSTFGLGPDSLVTDGYWSRLYCRAFVLETSPQD